MIESQYHCPYCGETIDTFIDTSAGDQRYIEDCAVCCRPIECHLHVYDEDNYSLEVKRDDE
jgi:hypothetical protein